MKLALDTNVWSLLVEQSGANTLLAAVEQAGWAIVVPPATLLEASRTRDSVQRSGLLKALLDNRLIHLYPEAFGECAEFIAESRRLRPAWQRATPAPILSRRWEEFWTHRLWQRARYDPDWIASYAWGQANPAEYGGLAAAQLHNRAQLGATHPKLTPNDLLVAVGEDESTLGLPPGARIDKWRVQNAGVFWEGLSRAATYGDGPRPTTYADWIEPWLLREAIRADRVDFNRFWYFEVEAVRMPRNWVRSAVDTLQWKYKIRDSNPFDEQQAAYLVDCDAYVTADHVFATVLREVVSKSPTPLAGIIEIARSASSGVEAVLEALTRLDPRESG